MTSRSHRPQPECSDVLSPHFTLPEVTRTSRESLAAGLTNRLDLTRPRDMEIALNLRRLVVNVAEPVRVELGVAMNVSSGYRSPQVNAATPGASKTSDHLTGCAIDFEAPPLSNLDIARRIRAMPDLPFHQLILEFHTVGDPFSGWIHLSHRPTGNRREVLTATFGARGKRVFAAGLPGDFPNPKVIT